MSLSYKRVTVIGLGKSGVAVAKLLAGKGYRVKVSEAGDDPLLRGRAEALRELRISAEVGGHRESFYGDAQALIPSPGVKPDAAPVQWAKRRGIPVLSELEVACRYAPCPVIAITGTNGKTTVTALVGEILKNAGKQCLVGGNIGTPLSDFVDQLTPDHWVVLEVSSFQLEYIERFRPRIAAILNFTPDHLDHHRDLEEYFGMKARITERQGPGDWLVLNDKDSKLKEVRDMSKAQVLFFNDGADDGYSNENERAVALIGRVLDISDEVIAQTLKRFKGVEHRLEEVISLHGIRFVNDSKSTNVDSLRWGLGNTPAPIHLIAGGRDKGGDFSTVKSQIREKVRRLVLMGEAKEKLQNAWDRLGIPLILANSLEEAVRAACQDAPGGTTVLLSPGCASFDLFKNYEDRGRQFKERVGRITEEMTGHVIKQ